MSAQYEWTTSPTVTSDLLERPDWKMSTSAKTRSSRRAVNQSTSNFGQTLRPVVQTIEQTRRPIVQTMRPTRQSQQPLQQPEQTQKQSRSRQFSAQSLQPTQQLQRPLRSRPRRQSLESPRESPLPQEKMRSTCRPSRPFQQQQVSHEMANQRVNNFEHFSEPPQPAKRRPNGVQESRQPRHHSQQVSDQRIQQSQQIPNHKYDRPREPSNSVPNHRANSSSAQQNPLPSQQTPASFPSLQRRHSDSNNSSESYIALSPDRRREIITSVNETVQYVMASMLSDQASNVQWKPKLRKKDISYYMDEISVKPGQTRFCCVSHTHASVGEIMKLFVVSDADSMTRNTRVFSESLLETRVLSILRRPTKQRPMNSMYVQHTCYRSPGLIADREVCIAVATDMIHQPDGSTIGYCLWETVDGPEFAEATNKLEPCIMFRSGFFLRRSGRQRTDYPNQSYTKIVYIVGLEPGGWAPGLTSRLLMEKFGMNLTRLCSHFRRKQLDSRTFVMKTQWPSKMSAKSCKQCEKQFQVLSNRVNCHSCGYVVCRSCVSKELVELHAVGLVSMHVCFSCLEEAGLPTRASSKKTQSSLGRRRLQSDTTNDLRVATQQPLSQPQPYVQSRSVVASDFIEKDDDDSDTGEWAFTPSGVPVRPYRMAS